MSQPSFVRPFKSQEEYRLMIDYFVTSDDEFLLGMGVDPKKLPNRERWLDDVWAHHQRADQEKERAYVAWIYDGEIVGHSSISKIKWGEEASVHLHLWRPHLRRSGLGTELFCRSVNFFLKTFRLKKIYCEPYAGNPGPNKVLSKIGFAFVQRYRTVPGPVNFEQDVNRYELNHEINLEAVCAPSRSA